MISGEDEKGFGGRGESCWKCAERREAEFNFERSGAFQICRLRFHYEIISKSKGRTVLDCLAMWCFMKKRGASKEKYFYYLTFFYFSDDLFSEKRLNGRKLKEKNIKGNKLHETDFFFFTFTIGTMKNTY